MLPPNYFLCAHLTERRPFAGREPPGGRQGSSPPRPVSGILLTVLALLPWLDLPSR